MSNRAERRACRMAERIAARLSDPVHPAVRWLRSVGLASTCLGFGGLVTVYFWPSVVFVYLGLTLMLVDLYLERFERHGWLRYMIMIAMLVGICAFTWRTVLRQAPLVTRAYVSKTAYPSGTTSAGIRWYPNMRDLHVTLENDTDEDYERGYFHIQIAAPILAKGQLGNIPGVQFVENEMSARQNVKGPDGKAVNVPLLVSQNHYRVRCETLPRHESLELSFAILENDLPKVKEATIEGSYRGGFRTRHMNVTMSVGVFE